AASPTVVAAPFDSTKQPDGLYFLRLLATAEDGGTVFSPTVGPVRVDNTPPEAALEPPAVRLEGLVTLRATADDRSGSGVTSARFERAGAGTGVWVGVGVDRTAPSQTFFDTTEVPNGFYDLRAVARDAAGNTAPSASVEASTSTTRSSRLRPKPR